MGRRKRVNGRCVRQERFNGDEGGVCEADGEDLISKLPDDILVAILSGMTMKEAARTSVLSWRWRGLWTFSSGSLSFDTQSKALPLKSKKRRRCLSGEGRLSIVSWWSKVMESHKGPRINELAVFASSKFTESECDVSQCISFAMKKRVQKLVLGSTLRCQFPSPSSLGLSSFNFLKSLTLKTSAVTGEEIECFLSNCPDLECLSLQLFRCLGAMMTISSPSLKSLKLFQLGSHTNVKVSAPKLLIFNYRGCPVSYEFENVPNLIDVSLGWVWCESSLFEELSNILSRVERLTLAVVLNGGARCARIPELRNLKEVELNLSLKDDSNVVMFCASLMKASPSLCKCELRLSWSRFPKAVVTSTQEAENHPHPCLKVVKLTGFTGRKLDIELANYVVENALLLEELTIAYDREKPKFWGFEEFQEEIDWDRWLEAKMSPGAKLVVI